MGAKRKLIKSKVKSLKGGVRAGAGRPRLQLTDAEWQQRRKVQSVERRKGSVSVRINKDTFAKLQNLQAVVKAKSISAAMSEAVKLYSKSCATSGHR